MPNLKFNFLKANFLKNDQLGSSKVAMVHQPPEKVLLVPIHRRLYTKEKQWQTTAKWKNRKKSF